MSIAQFTLSDSGVLLDALHAIDANAREFVLVLDNRGRAAGTVTDGDIRRSLLASGGNFSTPIVDIMKRDFIFVSPNMPRGHVLDLMRARQIRQVPVLDEERRPVAFHFLNELIGSVEKPNHAVIMAGGKGTRLHPLTQSRPKPLLPVAGKPILEHLVLHLVGHGIRTIWLSINYLGEMIAAHFGDGSAHGCAINYLREERELGTAGALSLLPAMVEPFLVLNGDLMTQCDISGLLEHHRRSGAAATICVKRHHYEVPFGVVEIENGLVANMLEKPTCSYTVNAGIYALDPHMLSFIPPATRITMPDVLERARRGGHSVAAYESIEDWLDVGRPSELSRARGEQ